jgi:hypothetical protein
MGTLIAVKGLDYSVSGVSEVTPGGATISQTSSSDVKAGGSEVYCGDLTFTFSVGALKSSAWTGSNSLSTSAVTVTVSPTISKYKVDSKVPIVQGDSGTASVTGQAGTPDKPVPSSLSVTVTVSGAGQTTVFGS